MRNVLPFLRGNKLPLSTQTRHLSIPFSSYLEFLIYSISVLCEIPLFSGLAKIPLLYLLALATIVAKMGRGPSSLSVAAYLSIQRRKLGNAQTRNQRREAQSMGEGLS